MDQRRCHAAVDTAGKTENHFIAADLLANRFDRLRNIVRHIPVRFAAADLVHKPSEDCLTLQGMRDFRMKLHTVKFALFVGHCRNRTIVRRRHQLEAGRHLDHFVAVAHPYLQHAVSFGRHEVIDTRKERRMTACTHFGIAEFPNVADLNLAAQLLGHHLHAIADAEHRHANVEYRLRCTRRIAFGHRVGAAGKNDAGRTIVANEFIRYIVRIDFGKHTGFAHAARNQLGNLGTEIENEYFGMHVDWSKKSGNSKQFNFQLDSTVARITRFRPASFAA